MIETLESRRLFAAIILNGTAASDSIAITDIAGPWTQVQVNAATGFVLDVSYTDVEINGFGGDDKLVANVAKPTVMRGGDGNDYMVGGFVNDRMSGDGGNDRMYGRTGNDAMVGGAGNDSMAGGDHDDTLKGLDGNDVLLGEDGSDRISGGNGDDYVVGGNGRDIVAGDLGKDTYVVTADGALDQVHRNPFIDVVLGVPDGFDLFFVAP
jgi:Ca2+-binding RTX toxin-like protein